MNYTNLQAVRADIQAGATNCQALVRQYLDRIEATKALNIYIEVFEEEALEQARQLDQKYQQNPESIGRLFGMVLSLKDVLCYKDHEVTAGSRILQGFKSLFSATAVQRLLEEDAIIIGRVNCDQFAMGSDNGNSYYGQTWNAADPERVPGGSSGGCAASVQAHTCLASIGSDTGGSVRQPAAFCGLVGMKPTYGRISRYGLLAYASSFDQIGTISHSVADAALLLEVMAGPDEFDATASHRPVDTYSPLPTLDRKVRIAYFEAALQHEQIDESIRELSMDFIEKLRSDGHSVEAVPFDLLDYIIPAYYVLTTAEASSNLSRYDGIRFGYRQREAADLSETYKKSRTEGFSPEVKRRIMLGTFVLSAGYYDAYYTKAQKVRRLIHQRTNEIFEEYDFILMPATPGVAWKGGDKSNDPVEMYLADIFTVQANMAGIPAVCIPLGEGTANMPVGIQIMGQAFKEQEMLCFARHYGPDQGQSA
ncbi:MAG: Asp-tRNA(Asn)/Glu-tRNA(Gln) amidotransferase subunit GatA [Bacteroidota bacterium]